MSVDILSEIVAVLTVEDLPELILSHLVGEGVLPLSDINALEKYYGKTTKNGRTYLGKTNFLHSFNDEPAIVQIDGTKEWYINGERHRENKPAIEEADGTKEWYINGRRHREDGPAVEYPIAPIRWYCNGKIHQKYGQVVQWWINGKRQK
jgi:hypothetical protein